MAETITETNFELPGQIGEVYRGKVGDVYTIEHQGNELLAVVRTDRISAYDAILPKPIPHKGQVLNEMSHELLIASCKDTAPYGQMAIPDPNVSIGLKADPIKVEMIMRGYLLGSAWRDYNEHGMRKLCDNELPDGMSEFDPFETPLLTPTTKADKGDRDVNITRQEILDRGLATEEEYQEMERIAKALYSKGRQMAHEKRLVLADTKYELGRVALGSMTKIMVIDEVHTPDSSRYYPEDEYLAYLLGDTDKRPKQRSKEFVREWLAAQGFMNEPGQVMPYIPDEFVNEVSDEYIQLYEDMLGKKFEPADNTNLVERIRTNIEQWLNETASLLHPL